MRSLSHRRAIVRRNSLRVLRRRRLAGLLAFAASATAVIGPIATTDALADSPPGSGPFVPLSATRVIDTTAHSIVDGIDGVTHTGKLQPFETVNFVFPGQGGIPSSGVLAVVLHVTTLNGSNGGQVGDGMLWVYPTTSGSAVPNRPTTCGRSGTPSPTRAPV